jgi:hypothetical protein
MRKTLITTAFAAAVLAAPMAHAQILGGSGGLTGNVGGGLGGASGALGGSFGGAGQLGAPDLSSTTSRIRGTADTARALPSVAATRKGSIAPSGSVGLGGSASKSGASASANGAGSASVRRD